MSDTTEDAQLVEQLAELVDARLLDPLEALLESAAAVDSLRRWVRRLATTWVTELLGSDDRRAADTATRLVRALYGDTEFRPPAGWWRTPLGRAIARRVGHPIADRVSYAVAGDILGITRQGVHDLVARDKLDRHPEGGVRSGSVRDRLGGGPNT